jgi:signal transduction histidine kinase
MVAGGNYIHFARLLKIFTCNGTVAIPTEKSAYTTFMNKEEKISLLQLVYKGLGDESLAEIAELSRICSYPANHLLCREGEHEDVLYVIAEGKVIISQRLGEEESTRILRVGGKGDVIGEMGLIQNAPRSASVRTTTACNMLEMDKKDFESILSKNPRIALDLIGITLDRLRENDKNSISDLQKTNKMLRQMDRNKMEFIQVTAHELRTPLTVLKGYVNVLQASLDTEAKKNLGEVLQGIDKGTDRMHEIVNTMLDLTRIDADTFKINPVTVPVKQILKKVSYKLSKAAEERNIAVSIEHDADTPNIKADPALMEKALHHLLVNAIKYTPDGGKITINASPSMLENNAKSAKISIRDTGIGLDAEHHELVFEKFYQVAGVATHSSGKTTFKGGGSGLGLAIVRGIAEAHGGKTWVESEGYDEENCPGSIFYLEIPAT